MARQTCAECGEAIDEEVVWYRQFPRLVREDSQSWRFITTVSRVQRAEDDLPLHPGCFRTRTGQEWPPPE